MTKDTDQQETLIEFPCEFPIKVMGETHESFSIETTLETSFNTDIHMDYC